VNNVIGWSVSIADSGDNMADGFASEADAYEWLEANVPESNHESYEVEAETSEEAADLVMSGEVDELETDEYDYDIIENEEIK